MHLPRSLGVRETISTKKPPEAVSIFDNAGTALEEFGITESGNEIQGYVKVASGTLITLCFDIPCKEPQIVDIFIDGILRESIVTASAPVKTHRGKISRVCACAIRPSGVKGKLEYCEMVVEDRKLSKDIPTSAPGFADLRASAVGTIEVRVLREIKSASKSYRDVKLEQAERGPTFEDKLQWWDVSRRVDPGTIAPMYQIGFINGRKTYGNSRKNINRNIEDYYLWASFKFLYRSALGLQAAGIENTGNLPNLPSKIIGMMASTQSATVSSVDKEPITILMTTSGLPVSQVDSELLHPSDNGTLKGLDDSETPGYGEHVREQFQVITPKKSSQIYNTTDVILTENRISGDVVDSEWSSNDYSETEHSDDEIDAKLNRLNKDTVQGERNVEPVNEEGSKTQAAAPGSHEPKVLNAEQAAAAYDKEPAVENIQDETLTTPTPQPEDYRDCTAAEKFTGGSKTSEPTAEKRLQDFHSRNTEFEDYVYGENQLELPDPIPFNSKAENRVTIDGPQTQHSPAVISFLPPPPFSDSAQTDTTVHEDAIGPKTQPDLGPSKMIPEMSHVGPKLMRRSKAGHYTIISPLVASDVEDIEKKAKAMTNGRGDWRGRFTHLVEELYAPSKNRAISEGPPGMTAIEQSANQNLGALSLPGFLSDTTKKRKFGEFDIDVDTNIRPNPNLKSSFRKPDSLGMSPKERRQELAREKRTKQEALEKAKAEADALRKQIEEIEARQAEAIAREEAELKELDVEIENVQEEAQALAARLRELHDQ